MTLKATGSLLILKRHLELKESLKEFKVDGYEELIKAAKAAMEEDDPGLVQHKLHQLAIANGYRDSSAVSRLLLAHEEYATGSNEMSLKQLFAEAEQKDVEFLIPDLVPLPGTMLFHGLGGCGKTMTAMHIARHVARGLPYTIKGREVPVKQGRVLWLNGDQNPSRLYRQFQEAGYGPDDDVIVLSGVSMLWQPWFIRQIEKHKPRLVVWDSVTSCMRGSAVDQNRAEYADPMYFYSAKNGTAYDAIGQIFIHHQNQEGGARGTTALVDAVDEVWSIRKPNKDEKEKLGNNRVIEIGKSREDNEGRTFFVKRKDDLTLQIDETCDLAGPSESAIDQMLGALRFRDDWMTAQQIYALPIGGTEGSKKVNLNRLRNKGLVERRGSRGSYQFRAVLSHAPAHVGAGGLVTKQIEIKDVPGDLERYKKETVSNERFETQKTSFKNVTSLLTDQNPVSDSDLDRNAAGGTGPHTRGPIKLEDLDSEGKI